MTLFVFRLDKVVKAPNKKNDDDNDTQSRAPCVWISLTTQPGCRLSPGLIKCTQSTRTDTKYI